MKRGGELRIGQNELTAFVVIEITGNSTFRPTQLEVEFVESPAQPSETESEFDSLSIDDKDARTGEECIP
jgi:hypothetical protein